MAFNKKDISFRYLFDIETSTLHDLKSSKNPSNENCGLDFLKNWVAFNTEREPVEGAVIKKLTATKELVDIEVKSLCPYCMTPEDKELISLLHDYFLKG